MVGIRGVDPERKNGVEAFFDAFRLIKRTDVISAFFFRHTRFYESGGFFHTGVIDPGGFPHFFFFIFILDGTDVIHTGGGIDITYSGIAFHQIKKEACGPAFVYAHISFCVHCSRYGSDTVVRICHPYFLHINFRDDEKLVQEEFMLPICSEIQRIESFVRFNPDTGKIPDA